MIDYREVIRLNVTGHSNITVATSVGSSRNTVADIWKCTEDRQITWPIPSTLTNEDFKKILYPEMQNENWRLMPDYEYIYNELAKHWRQGLYERKIWFKSYSEKGRWFLMLKDDYTAWDECSEYEDCEMIRDFLVLVDAMINDIKHLRAEVVRTCYTLSMQPTYPLATELKFRKACTNWTEYPQIVSYSAL